MRRVDKDCLKHVYCLYRQKTEQYKFSCAICKKRLNGRHLGGWRQTNGWENPETAKNNNNNGGVIGVSGKSTNPALTGEPLTAGCNQSQLECAASKEESTALNGQHGSGAIMHLFFLIFVILAAIGLLAVLNVDMSSISGWASDALSRILNR